MYSGQLEPWDTVGIHLFDSYDPSKHDEKYQDEEIGFNKCSSNWERLVTVKEYQNKKLLFE